MSGGMPWFRMYIDFLEDPKVISLAFEDQRHFVGVLALKASGVLDQDCDEKLMDRIVAQKLWIDYAIIGDVKKRLVNAGLISPDWHPLAWSKRQFVSDHDPTRNERQRRFKEKKKQEEKQKVGGGNASGNGSGNAPANGSGNAKLTPLDTDTDTEGDISHGKKTLSSELNFPKEHTLSSSQFELDGEVDFSAPKAQEEKTATIVPFEKRPLADRAAVILDYLNDTVGTSFRARDGKGKPTANLKLVMDRYRDGYTTQEICAVIDDRYKRWSPDDQRRLYLRPSTLFRKSNFETYLGQTPTRPSQEGMH